MTSENQKSVITRTRSLIKFVRSILEYYVFGFFCEKSTFWVLLDLKCNIFRVFHEEIFYFFGKIHGKLRNCIKIHKNTKKLFAYFHPNLYFFINLA